MNREEATVLLEVVAPELRLMKPPVWIGDAVILEVEAEMEFERSAVVDEEIWHQHWCWVCNAEWKDHDLSCERRGECAFSGEDMLCPDHQWSADPEVRG